MARKVIQTMSQKMGTSGKAPAKDVLDDTDLADDPIISAIQSLRLIVDDLQFNDNDLDITNLKTAVAANTSRGSGTDGAKGSTGEKGNTGEKGAKGDAGNAGSNGSDGADGNDGATGAAGATGATGAAGAKGDKGDTGDTGAAGNNGSNGSNGSDGAAGARGATGSAGAKGATGAAGANGSLAITEGYAAALEVTVSRGTYTLKINVTNKSIEGFGTKSTSFTLS